MKHPMLLAASAALLAGGLVDAAVTPYSTSSESDIKSSGRTLAYDLMSYYKGNLSGQTPGILPGPPPAGDYYWWEAGALWGTMMDYWHYTGDATYNDVVSQAMLFQVGPNANYMPPNVTASLGNDDQGFWGMSAMLAAEVNFPNPPADKPQWLALAQAVFNTQASPERHDSTCGGGLRWQIPFANAGYNYKNSIANGIFFNLGARLARYTGNTTYSDWAVKTWNWVNEVGYMTPEYQIYDGAHVETNCTDINKAQFSYNNGVFIQGAAHMWNHTQDPIWKTRVDGLLNATLNTFFPQSIAFEIACETGMTCTTDMLSFKGYVHRWLVNVAQLCPWTRQTIMTTLQTSAAAAVQTCTGGSDGRTCGFQWHMKAFDNSIGAGQQMDVLGAVSSLLIDEAAPPLTNATGGTSVGNANAGEGSDTLLGKPAPVTAAEKAGAAFLTLLVMACATGVFAWMSFGV